MSPLYPHVTRDQYLADRLREEAAKGIAASKLPFNPKTPVTGRALRLLKASNSLNEWFKEDLK